MANVDDHADDAAMTHAEAMALAEQAEAEATAAEALAAAARARARAMRLRREAEAQNENGQEATGATTTAPAPGAPQAGEPPATSSTGSPRQRRWRPHPRITGGLAGAAVVVICGLLATSGYMIWYNHTAVEQRQRSAAFAAAARQGVINLLSLDFNKAKQDVQRVIDSSTGEFRDDFQKRAGDFTTVVEQSKAVTEGAVAATAVESMSKDSAVVLVLGTERVTNAAGAKDEPRAFRLRVAVARDGDQIKLSKVEFVL